MQGYVLANQLNKNLVMSYDMYHVNSLPLQSYIKIKLPLQICPQSIASEDLFKKINVKFVFKTNIAVTLSKKISFFYNLIEKVFTCCPPLHRPKVPYFKMRKLMTSLCKILSRDYNYLEPFTKFGGAPN